MSGLYEALMAAAVPQQPLSLWQGISQPLSPPQVGSDPLSQMIAKQQQQRDPRAFMPTIDPGQTWGGRDRNNILPYDVQMGRTYMQPPENI